MGNRGNLELRTWLNFAGALCYVVESISELIWTSSYRRYCKRLAKVRHALDVQQCLDRLPWADVTASELQPEMVEELLSTLLEPKRRRHWMDSVDWNLWGALLFGIASLIALVGSVATPYILPFWIDVHTATVCIWASTITYLANALVFACSLRGILQLIEPSIPSSLFFVMRISGAVCSS